MRHLFTALFVLALVIPARALQTTQQPKYDLLLKAGHVIDPANGLEYRLQYEELMSESQDLCLEHGSAPETLPNRVEQREHDREHGIRKL
jgi:hypothetical protein